MRRRERDRIAAALEEAAPDLLRFLLRRTAGADAAADLFGEVSLVAWRRRGQAPAVDGEIRPWLFGIARNALLNHWRASRRALGLTEQLKAAATLEAPHRDHADDLADADLVRRLLDRLPQGAAELLRLVHWDGLHLAEAALVLGIPASTVRGRYAAAKQQLRGLLEHADP
ncbi:RNA polymerase sigma factor [uncultured Amnibacterium sp.]|uniref:RNA polymerase sigma factor n=1 Tax=uncultured Amnibacterium sp. TaxID=1631851 RepID=UPI0035CB1ED3